MLLSLHSVAKLSYNQQFVIFYLFTSWTFLVSQNLISESTKQYHLPLGGNKQPADSPQKTLPLWRNVWAERNSVRFRPQSRRRLRKKSGEEERAAMHAESFAIDTGVRVHSLACASPRWEPCASHPPGTHKACWEKPCAPEGPRTSLSAASCHERSSQQRAKKK